MFVRKKKTYYFFFLYIKFFETDSLNQDKDFEFIIDFGFFLFAMCPSYMRYGKTLKYYINIY